MANRIPSTAISGEALQQLSTKLLACSHQELSALPYASSDITDLKGSFHSPDVLSILGFMGGIAMHRYDIEGSLTFTQLHEETGQFIIRTHGKNASRFDAALKVASAVASGIFTECIPKPLRPEHGGGGVGLN